MKWNSHDQQRARQLSKNESYAPFGGTEIIHIPVWARIKLGFLLMVGIEIANIHVDIKNSGVDVAMAWIEALRKIPGMDKVWKAVDFAFGDSDGWTCRQCGCTDADCSQCIKASGSPCHWVEPDLCSRCKDEFDAAVDVAIEEFAAQAKAEAEYPQIPEHQIPGPEGA